MSCLFLAVGVPELFQRSQSHGPDRGPSSSGQRDHLLNGVEFPLPAAATELWRPTLSAAIIKKRATARSVRLCH